MTVAVGDWVLASTNRGKLAEYAALLADMPIRLDALAPDGPGVPEETGLTFVENALIKARHAAAVAGRPAIADDSGLCVRALDGAPGVVSARYAGRGASDADNIDRLLAALDGIADTNRDASFHCVIVALRSADDPAPLIADGRWPGRIAAAPRGEHGFGYDPVFVDIGTGQTAAELAPAVKNEISHRGRAARELVRLLAI